MSYPAYRHAQARNASQSTSNQPAPQTHQPMHQATLPGALPFYQGVPAPTIHQQNQPSNEAPSQPRRRRIAQPLRAEPEKKKEIQLVHNRKDRFKYDNLADLYSIILAAEHVETAYVRDSITANEYAPSCGKLIAQFKTQQAALDNLSVEEFMKEYELMCPAAKHRLLQVGVPATIEHGDAEAPTKSNQLYVAETVQHFITAMDSLKLEMYAVDEVHPHLNDLMDSLNKIPTVLPDHVSKVKVKGWLIELNRMKASDELTEEQARQLLFDLDNAYNEFVRLLQK